jgi:hypothetical protein
VRTEDLIRRLTSDLQPVRPLRPVVARALGWTVLAAASLVVVAILMGVRRDLGEVAARTDFAFEAALLIVTALSAAIGALAVGVPGARRVALACWLPVTAGVAVVLWAAGELAAASAAGEPAGRVTFAWQCIFKTASVGAIPGFVLFSMVRRAAPLYAARAGMLALLATSAVGVLGANVICPTDRPLHMLLWHVAPLVVFAVLGAGLGTWLLRWDRGLR